MISPASLDAPFLGSDDSIDSQIVLKALLKVKRLYQARTQVKGILLKLAEIDCLFYLDSEVSRLLYSDYTSHQGLSHLFN